MRLTSNRHVGSNPTYSATKKAPGFGCFFCGRCRWWGAHRFYKNGGARSHSEPNEALPTYIRRNSLSVEPKPYNHVKNSSHATYSATMSLFGFILPCRFCFRRVLDRGATGFPAKASEARFCGVIASRLYMSSTRHSAIFLK